MKDDDGVAMGRRPGSFGAGPATLRVALERPFSMYRGGRLQRLDVAYECWGELSPKRDNVVLLFTGLSPGPHAAAGPGDPRPGWWEYMVGPGAPVDTERFFVVCVNSLGSCFGSTGPAAQNPASGRPYALEFPELSVEDIAAAARALLAQLGLEWVRAVVGASLGGMSALAYCVQFPGRTGALVTISSAAQASAFAIAVRSLQREIIRCDPAWCGGDYAPQQPPVQGMRLARMLGLTSYRSAGEWQHRFGRQRLACGPKSSFGVEFEVESYLAYHADCFVGSFDPNCYLYLSRAMDWFDVLGHGDSVDGVLAAIDLPEALVIGVGTDVLFPLEQQLEIAEGLRLGGCRVTFEALGSEQGHDSFLVDRERFAPCVQRFFEDLR